LANPQLLKDLQITNSINFISRPLVLILDLSIKYTLVRSVSIDKYYVKLQLWDTAGQERFKGITKSYYTNADVVIIVYDNQDNKTFDDINKLWLT
jgi:GTPase SAR1 family protein